MAAFRVTNDFIVELCINFPKKLHDQKPVLCDVLTRSPAFVVIIQDREGVSKLIYLFVKCMRVRDEHIDQFRNVTTKANMRTNTSITFKTYVIEL